MTPAERSTDATTPAARRSSGPSYQDGVTIGTLKPGQDGEVLLPKMEARHRGEHDTVIVFVPPGTANDARDRIWKALVHNARGGWVWRCVCGCIRNNDGRVRTPNGV